MKISVITINYNNEYGLLKTIESVISQSYENLEYIIIDGASSDGSRGVIENYVDRISYWESQPDSGIYNAMNKGIGHITGEYCIFMNSGDVFCSPTVVANVVDKMIGCDIVCGNTLMPDKVLPPESITLNTLFEGTICHQCAFIKSDIMKEFMYDEKYKIVSDRKFFLQAFIIKNCSYERVDVDVVLYDTNGLSSANRFLSDYEYALVLEELLPERIRQDYGRKSLGGLYGDSDYDKLFIEIRKRNYKGLIYSMVVILIKIIACFKQSASYINKFPIKLK